MIKTTWSHKNFSQLSLGELYDILKLRADVFVVEQHCIYSDLDSHSGTLDRHSKTIHLLGYNEKNQLIAYLRILAKGQSYPEYTSIGRVVTAAPERGKGLGHALIEEGLKLCREYFPTESIKISAQQHLHAYYEQHGFRQVSEMYLEDGIPHISMIKGTSS